MGKCMAYAILLYICTRMDGGDDKDGRERS